MSRLTRKAGGGRALDSDAGILPLINVVFLLLIFFMIAGQLAEQAPFEVEPPASDAEAEDDGADRGKRDSREGTTTHFVSRGSAGWESGPCATQEGCD